MACLRRFFSLIALMLVFAAGPAGAADLVRLTEKTWEGFAPQGKEVDCIYGDFVLRNDRLVCVIADPIPGRNANMTVRDVGGCIIDLSRRPTNDQLGCYYPKLAGQQLAFAAAGAELATGKTFETGDLANLRESSEQVYLTCRSAATDALPAADVTYTLRDGWDYVLVETVYTNRGDKTLTVALSDAVRADRTFDRSPNNSGDLFWTNDRNFGQGYGVLFEDHHPLAKGNVLELQRLKSVEAQPADRVTLGPEDTYKIARKIFPGNSLFHVLELARNLRGEEQAAVELRVRDMGGKPIAGADVFIPAADAKNPPLGHARTGADGVLKFALPKGKHTLKVAGIGRETVSLDVDTERHTAFDVQMSDPGYVRGKITSETGGPIPCKIQFRGVGDTPDPDFGPESGETAVKNLHYSHTGQFLQPIAPGQYQAIVSYGPEHDAAFVEIEVARGKETPLSAKLVRSVKSEGWISADFHNHSSPSGDNTSSQFGRVLNILCEQIEFAPCTEHNRISSYTPHLKRLAVEKLMATCSGIELTGKPLPINHQNAFPLVEKPRTQDGGAPVTDEDPSVQIERLALWDGKSEKLIQQNHPDIGWLFYDKNGDGLPDQGFEKSLPYMDVIEVHPIEWMLKEPLVEIRGRKENNRVFNWLQLLNQGRRVPGVVNTDSHYNFHESGFWRNYIQSPTDDPAKVQVLDVVRASEKGHIVLTTAPFLEVLLTADG
ncbi:MAG: carboxypeptidase regulatory-like domain-containing protein, partial [Planctomycetia bacterium]|nr:carboxypeptidase regulatory-like domain-containing protein [Planctomycetia bacterium]